MNNLHPWGIIFDYIMNLSSDQICRIIDLTGLQVNWTITAEQEFSDKTRKRAYRSKISSAYNQLDENEKLLTTQNIVNQLSQEGDLSEKLNGQLDKIGWTIVSGTLTSDNVNVIERFFPKGTEHDSYVMIRTIIQKTLSNIIIIDPYLDSTILEMLGTLTINPNIKILSHKLPLDFNSEIERYKIQHSEVEIEVRKTEEFHDRFIIINDNECYHIGSSIKDSGSKSYMISKIEDVHNISSLVGQFKKSWDKAKNL
jgi:hypothetical protein